jgi:hypothetical protein
LPSYTGISNGAVGNTIYNKDVSHRFYAIKYHKITIMDLAIPQKFGKFPDWLRKY